MATKTSNSIPVREKTGKFPPNVPQNTRTLHYRKSPNPSRTPSPAKNHDQTTPEKHIPNYLKPTISSALHLPNQQYKKTISTDIPHKSNHTRRRSLDIPPPSPKHQFEKLASTESRQQPILTRRKSFNIPPSPSQKSRVSPSPIIRSSSFSSKTTSKVPRDDGKKRILNAANGAKKGSADYKKRASEIGILTTKEEVTVTTPQKDWETPKTPEIPQLEDEELFITETEKSTAKDVGENDEKRVEVPLLEDQEPMNIDQQSEAETDKSVNIPTAVSPKQELEHITAEINRKIIDESEEVEEEEVDEVTTLMKEDETVNGSETNEEEKKELENAAVKKEVKKDSVVSNSNDVIEETASKLREQRKNKVKALAGAFETVISLQETK